MENQDTYFYLMHKYDAIAVLKIDPLSSACLKAEVVGPAELVPEDEFILDMLKKGQAFDPEYILREYKNRLNYYKGLSLQR